MGKKEEMLQMMEIIAGHPILQKPPIPQKPQKPPIPQKPLRRVSSIRIVRNGNLNKKCPGCGHKQKKCTCG